jgi:hypothetical protein
MLLLPIAFALEQIDKYGPLVTLIVAGFEPIWIESIMNPAQILSVPYLTLLRNPPVDVSLYPILDSAINLVNFLPIASFLLIIPVGLIVIPTNRYRFWWSATWSAITFAAIFVVLVVTLDLVRVYFEYSLYDYFMFGLLLVQLWIPMLLVATPISWPTDDVA